MSRVDQQLQCEKCGSVYFQSADFREFHAGYSANPGSELYPMEGPSVSVRVCLCGHPMPRVGTVGRETRRNFAASLETALAFRATREPKALRKHFANKYASRKELVEMQAALVRLQELIADRNRVVAPRRESAFAPGGKNSGSGGSNAVTRAGLKQKTAEPRRKA
jgi:hypothetical protein